MDLFNQLRAHSSFKVLCVSTLFLSLFACEIASGAQDAVVKADQAIVYADEQMSAPIGFVKKGKKIKIGDIPRNRAQVYPILVSGKVAYIKAIDISTEKESVDSGVLVAERFQRGTMEEHKKNYSVSFFNYSSQVSLEKENTHLKNKDPVDWYGVSVRGGAQVTPKWDIDVIVNVLNGKASEEAFRSFEFGLGAALRVYDQKRLQIKILTQLLAVPFATYAVGNDFRVNGYGYGAGAALSTTYRLGKNWGVEAYGGFYYTKLMGFNVPSPYNKINPSFLGTRLGAGLNYQF